MDKKFIQDIMAMPDQDEYVEQHSRCPEVVPTAEVMRWLHDLIRHQLHMECKLLRSGNPKAPPNLFVAAFMTILERWEIRHQIETATDDWQSNPAIVDAASELTEELAVKVFRNTVEWLGLWLGPLELAEATYREGRILHPANIQLQDNPDAMLEDPANYWADAAPAPVGLDLLPVTLAIGQLRSELVHGADRMHRHAEAGGKSKNYPLPLAFITALYLGYFQKGLGPKQAMGDEEMFGGLLYQSESIIFGVLQALELLVDQGCLVPPTAIGDA